MKVSNHPITQAGPTLHFCSLETSVALQSEQRFQREIFQLFVTHWDELLTKWCRRKEAANLAVVHSWSCCWMFERLYACIYLNYICCCTDYCNPAVQSLFFFSVVWFPFSLSFSLFLTRLFLIPVNSLSWCLKSALMSIAASGQAGCCLSEANLFIWQVCSLKYSLL